MAAEGTERSILESGNPLAVESAPQWHELIDAVNPAGLLLLIEDRMSAVLRKRTTPEDVLQESLLQAWRDRQSFQWRGLKSFRAWLLTIIDHRIRDAADHEFAQKRGGPTPPMQLSALGGRGDSDAPTQLAAAIASTTPSRVAMYREQATVIRETLEMLPEDLRNVVRFRLIDQLTIEETAGRMGITPSAARHRFRKGAEVYRQRLRGLLTSRSVGSPGKTTPHDRPNSAS